MQDAFVDNSYVKEEIIHKIVEVRVWEGKKPKKEKKSKRSHSSESESTVMSVDEEEYNAIKRDIKDLKALLRLMKRKSDDLDRGIRGWYEHFDTDKSDEIEIKEFVQMIIYLKIDLNDRLGIMLFRLFDRRNIGCFSYAEFSDILLRKLKPNFKRIVRAERLRFSLEGLNINWPERKKNEAQIVYIEKPAVIKEKIVERPVYKDRIVEKQVIVEKPVYIENKGEP